MLVVAAALQRYDGRWLMQRRPPNKHHGGLWEFPGGKVEVAEMPVLSLVRELAEELDIRAEAEALQPFGFAEAVGSEGAGAIVILLYTLRHWTGVPKSLEGGAVGWFTPDEALALAMPPLDIALARRLFQNR
jgi:8-oxo-dGTP diphosphatase